MIDSRRTHTVFRGFFDDQMDHLQNLVSNLTNRTHDAAPQTAEEQLIIENFVAASNSKMRAVDDYVNKLREHVSKLHHYVLQIIDQIPPAIDLNLNAFGADELVNALFVNRNDIDKLLKNCPEIKVFLRSRDISTVYALLTADKSEKLTLGIGLQGDMLMRDIPQETVNFSAHKIHTPCTSSAELNSVLKEYLFSHVVALLKQEMSDLMSDQAINMDKSYEARLKSLANPNVYLDRLIQQIENPTELLRLNKIHFKLSKLGIKLENDDQQNANEFDIHEIIWRNRIRRVVLQVKLSANSCNTLL